MATSSLCLLVCVAALATTGEARFALSSERIEAGERGLPLALGSLGRLRPPARDRLPVVVQRLQRERQLDDITEAAVGAHPEAEKDSAEYQCESARQQVQTAADLAWSQLKDAINVSTLNPLADFGARADAAYNSLLAAYDVDAAQWKGSEAYRVARGQLEVSMQSNMWELYTSQLRNLEVDCWMTFIADLTKLMVSSATYAKPARKLLERAAKRFDGLARAAVPTVLEAKGSDGSESSCDPATLVQERTEALRSAMAAEVESHKAEAEMLPPREMDVGPPPWWKQILAQALGMGLNIAQGVLLERLSAVVPARRPPEAATTPPPPLWKQFLDQDWE